jgi:hypothetical protein
MSSRIVAIGIDIGGTKTAVGLVNPQGQILHHIEFPTRPEDGPSAWSISRAKSSITLNSPPGPRTVLRLVSNAWWPPFGNSERKHPPPAIWRALALVAPDR